MKNTFTNLDKLKEISDLFLKEIDKQEETKKEETDGKIQ